MTESARHPLRIAVCQPVVGQVPPEAFQSQFRAFHTAQTANVLAGFCFANHTYIDKARNDLVVQAAKLDATHLLWVDADMVLTDDTILRLVAHGKQIVSGLYHKRKAPFEPVAYDDLPFRTAKLADGGGLQQVHAVGLGCCLMTMEVFERLAYPWFRVRWDPPGEGEDPHDADQWTFVGEDIHLFYAIRDLNIPVWLDTDLHLGHATTATITHQDFLDHRDEEITS